MMPLREYRIVERDPHVNACPAVETVVYEYRGHDYGMVRDDSRARNERCGAFTHLKGDDSFFVIPLACVEEIKP